MLQSLLEHFLAILQVICMYGCLIGSFAPKVSLFWYEGPKTILRALMIWGTAMAGVAIANIIYYTWAT